jgi:hypothetical protein
MDASVDAHPEPPKRFDPYNFFPVLPKWLRTRPAGALVLAAAGAAVGLLVALLAVLDGTFGGPGDFRLVDDVRHLFSEQVPVTPPRFPLVRDVSSVAFFVVVVFGVVLLQRQWRFIAHCIGGLRANGAITPLRQPRDTWVARVMGLRRLLGDTPDYGALDRLDERLGKIRRRTKVLLAGLVLVVSAILSVLLAVGLNGRVFLVLAPTEVSPEAQRQWLEEARANWWAGPDHPAGMIVYGILGCFAMALILAFNCVGVVSVYVAVALHHVARTGADWYNRDGRYGWTPVAKVIRTVYSSLVLYGVALSLLVAVLGSEVTITVTFLAVLYLVLVPIYTLVPWLVFRTVEGTAKEERIAFLNRQLAEVDPDDLARVQTLVAEFDRCRAAKIRPMRLRTASFGAFATFVLLPVALVVLQVVAEVGLGGR